MNIEPNPTVPGDAPPGADDDHNKLILNWDEPGGHHVREARQLARRIKAEAEALEADAMVPDRTPMDLARVLSHFHKLIDDGHTGIRRTKNPRGRAPLMRETGVILERYARVAGMLGADPGPTSVTVVRVDSGPQRRLMDDPEYRRRAIELEEMEILAAEDANGRDGDGG